MSSLVLASTSPYRKELLTRLGLPFRTAAPDVDERVLTGETPRQLVMRLSELKARTVAADYPDALIIGSDQVAVLDGEIVGKPGDHQHALEQLRRASGRELLFITGLCVLNSRSGQARVEACDYTVVFRRLSDRQIENYLAREQAYQCTGSFKSEGLGIALCERFEGDDPSALIGLPLMRLCQLLHLEGVEVL